MTTTTARGLRDEPDSGGPAAPAVTGGAPRWRAWARTLAGVAVLAAVVWWYPREAFTDAFSAVDPGSALAALGVGAATTVLCAVRWRVVARGVGLRLPLRRAVADYYLSVFLNAVLPAGVLGDVNRAVGHGRYSGDLGRGVRAVVLERTVGQVVLAAAGAVLLFALPTALLGPGLRTVGVSAGVIAVVALAVAVGLWAGRARGSRWWRALRTAVADARAGVFAHGSLLVALSAAALAGHVSLFVLAARLAGSAAPLPQLVPLLVLALLAMSMPVNVGGWGPREAVTALAFGAAGLGAATGLTASVVYGLLALVAALPGAAVLLVRLLRHRRAGASGATGATAPVHRPRGPAPEGLPSGAR
ncbi:lysylphosphatidylglycerol synthase transmembrane domain-containing protein [Nocardiopsis sp. CT-R113]|uniref:Lysylphosphatidylglycerol synthase transmembrane domain-containing protein n=1 Tax=Nocardiopsis codii TaxID=3065942 RepID=A0ABU7K5N9_9ACTN|nr:lysylphosphatidylglycerol synthase transmembrane domain-containing protein [Nocardiopsis sp. CT-R113]MEE2037509.1 lysylphosphatidylglycerol synthase transmembrane domain-containing protein [Nocardiopsis sp. CT-R113]